MARWTPTCCSTMAPSMGVRSWRTSSCFTGLRSSAPSAGGLQRGTTQTLSGPVMCAPSPPASPTVSGEARRGPDIEDVAHALGVAAPRWRRLRRPPRRAASSWPFDKNLLALSMGTLWNASSNTARKSRSRGRPKARSAASRKASRSPGSAWDLQRATTTSRTARCAALTAPRASSSQLLTTSARAMSALAALSAQGASRRRIACPSKSPPPASCAALSDWMASRVLSAACSPAREPSCADCDAAVCPDASSAW